MNILYSITHDHDISKIIDGSQSEISCDMEYMVWVQGHLYSVKITDKDHLSSWLHDILALI